MIIVIRRHPYKYQTMPKQIIIEKMEQIFHNRGHSYDTDSEMLPIAHGCCVDERCAFFRFILKCIYKPEPSTKTLKHAHH